MEMSTANDRIVSAYRHPVLGPIRNVPADDFSSSTSFPEHHHIQTSVASTLSFLINSCFFDMSNGKFDAIEP